MPPPVHKDIAIKYLRYYSLYGEYMNNLVFFGGNEIRLLLGNSPPLEEWGELTPPPSSSTWGPWRIARGPPWSRWPPRLRDSPKPFYSHDTTFWKMESFHQYIKNSSLIYIYLWSIADQTAKPKWLPFLRKPMCKLGVT